MSDTPTPAGPDRLAAALPATAWLLQGFSMIYLLIWAIGTGPLRGHWRLADPLVQLLGFPTGPWIVPVVGLIPLIVWQWFPGIEAAGGPRRGLNRPTAEPSPGPRGSDRPLRQAALALAVAAAGLGLARLVFGPELPAFIPPEESARAGLVLGLGAGILEESIFRLMLLPSVAILLGRVLPWPAAAALAVVVTALAFAGVHELDPMGRPFDPVLFATRALLPGALMSVLFFYPGPAFVVTLHCAAHLGIPYLFPG